MSSQSLPLPETSDKKNNFLEDLNEEKQEIVKTKGNILVVANPGTGKTKLLVYKYVWLICEEKIKPEEILCLTFTNKAKKEFEDRLIELIKELKIEIDFSRLNIHTFHSFALDNLNEEKVVSNNLLRYAIYQFIKEKEMLNYGDSYLIEVIVPKMENLLRYLKSFGITPDKIDLKEVKKHLQENEKVTKEELDTFAGYFLDIFKHYEEMKAKVGIDYSDMLVKFHNLKKLPNFKYVLVDELQDVNNIEAEIALKCGDNFVAVGDKKQAIFGFQGGSILNFKMFEKSKEFILTENFRSSNKILEYARDQFIGKTKEPSHKKELDKLKNKEKTDGIKPLVYNVERERVEESIAELVKTLNGRVEKLAIIARTNGQVMEISKALKDRKITHSSTFFSASQETKKNIIKFLKGILSDKIEDIKNSMFTPFFPISIQDAFTIAEQENLTLEQIYNKCPEFKKLRESVKTIEDLNSLFVQKITPVAVIYGKEYLLAALNVQKAFTEAVYELQDINLKNFIDYLDSSDLLKNESDVEGKIVVTTVHKAKGKEYNAVIYAPKKTRDTSNFQDNVAEAILCSKGINAKEELEEEFLRIDFVAFTRAKDELHIITDDPEKYLTDYSERAELKVESIERFDVSERSIKAYNLFVNGETDKAKELISNNNLWLKDYIINHFKGLDKISFSSLCDNAYDYLVYNLLDLNEPSKEKDLGSEVHEIAEAVAKGEKIEVREKLKPYYENIKSTLEEIRKSYPKIVETEKKFALPISKIISTKDEITFKGFIDLILSNDKGEYLIFDWKTNKKPDSKYKQQLESYKKAYSVENNIPLDKIKVALGYIGLRGTINLGKIDKELDFKQPVKTAFDTFTKKVNRVLSWKNDPESFLQELSQKELDDALWRSVVQQYKMEEEND